MNLYLESMLDKPSITTPYCPFAADPPRRRTISCRVRKAGLTALRSMFAALATPLVATAYCIAIAFIFVSQMAGNISGQTGRQNTRRHF